MHAIDQTLYLTYRMNRLNQCHMYYFYYHSVLSYSYNWLDYMQMLMQIADDFIDNVVSAACQLAKHRKSNTVEVKDVQMHLG